MSGSNSGTNTSPNALGMPSNGYQAPAPYNPLQTIGQFTQLQNQINQNKLFPGQLQQQQQATQNNQINLQKNINGAVYQAQAPLLALPNGTITHDKVTSSLASTEANLGLPTGGIVNDILANAPQGDGPAFDAYIRSIYAPRMMTTPESSLAAVTPKQTPVDYGSGIQQMNVAAPGQPNVGAMSPVGPGVTKNLGPQFVGTGGAQLPTNGGQPTGQGIAMTPSPADMNQLQKVFNPQTGQFDYVPRTTVAPMVNGAGQPVAGGAPSPLGTGHYQPAGGAPQGSNVAEPAPGTPENMAASALSAHAANQRASTFASDIYPLQQAQTALANAPTGKGSQAAHDASAYIGTFAPSWVQKGLSFISPIMTSDQQASYDEAKKYLTQGTLGAPGATRSNEGLNTAGAANPSVDISPQAAQLVLKGMIGLRRMEQDATVNFNKSGLPPSDYDKYQTQFATQADPRAYMFDQMTPTQRQQTLAGFKTPQARSAFEMQVERAESNGVLTAPGAANGQ